MKKLFLLLSLAFTFSACPLYEKGYEIAVFINESDEEICFIPYMISSEEYEEYHNRREFVSHSQFFTIWVEPHQEKEHEYALSSLHFDTSDNDIVVIDVIDKAYKDLIGNRDKIDNVSLGSIKIIHRYLYTEKELDKIHWRITYPPNDK